MKAKLHWLLSLPGRLLRSIFGGMITVEWTTASELATEEAQPLILAELRKQTTLLEVLAKQGDAGLAAALPTKTDGGFWMDAVGLRQPVWVASEFPDGDRGFISKSALEDEMKRRGVLRDKPPGTA